MSGLLLAILICQWALIWIAKFSIEFATVSRLVAGVICPLATSWDVVTKRPVPTVVFSQVLAHGRLHLKIGRGDWIRTSDLLLPKQLRYRAALRPVAKNGKGRGERKTPGLRLPPWHVLCSGYPPALTVCLTATEPWEDCSPDCRGLTLMTIDSSLTGSPGMCICEMPER